MPERSWSWKRAIARHDAAAARFVDAVNAIPVARWHVPRAAGKWSPAEEVLHVAMTYEMAVRALTRGEAMRPRVSPLRASLLRRLVLPVIVRTRWFPRATAPVEVRPPLDGTPVPTRDNAALRVRDAATAVSTAVGTAAQGADARLRFEHAYFGPLSTMQALRLLSAHTLHHTRVLRRQAARRDATS